MNKMKTTLGIGLAAMAAITFAPVTHAADTDVKKEKWFAKADKNKDGMLSKEEYMAASDKKMKKDSDKAAVKKDDVDAATADKTSDTGDNIE